MFDDEEKIDECEEQDSKLTNWECEFLSSIRDQLYDGNELSDKQSEVLDKIHRRVTL